VSTAFCGGDGTCAARLGPGGSCKGQSGTLYNACDDSSYCDGASGQCAAKKGAGSPCKSDSECQSKGCFDPTGGANRVCLQNAIGTPELCSGQKESASAPTSP
jgi:hypothetical protein